MLKYVRIIYNAKYYVQYAAFHNDFSRKENYLL